MNISKDKREALKSITHARLVLNRYLKDGSITDMDLVETFKKSANFGINSKSKKEIFNVIYSAPFLLCDQKYLSKNIKTILPFIINHKYNIEVSELDRLFESGFIGVEEYDKEKDLLTYIYYKTSKEGKKILEDNITKETKSK